MMLISPLAARLCKKMGLNPATLQGRGPRGRIMAADVLCPSPAQRHPGETAMGSFSTPTTRPTKDGYYVFDSVVNMAALAAMSLPIAVQCEKLLENRYSLFDFITRAVVKASLRYGAWKDANTPIDVLLFEKEGENVVALRDAAHKTIYKLARETSAPKELPTDYHPHIVVCDSGTSRDRVARHLSQGMRRPLFAFVARGGAPKVGIRAGRGEFSSYELSYTFYADTSVPEAEAKGIAACLYTMLINPVRLLLLS